jgi:hypothetical protein
MARSSPHQVSANCDWAKWKEVGGGNEKAPSVGAVGAWGSFESRDASV